MDYYIEKSTLKIGENTLKIWLGQLINKLGEPFKKYGDEIISRNQTKLITNPSAKLYNPWILVISFTVDVSKKYQLTFEGDYKQKYKECDNGDINLSEKEMFLIINQNSKSWFKKD